MKITERPGELPLSEQVYTAVLKRNVTRAAAKGAQTPDAFVSKAADGLGSARASFGKAGCDNAEDSEVILAEEYLMRVLVNDTPVMQIVCTPTFLPELVLGRLLTEGYIRSKEEVRLIDVCREGSIAKVYLQKGTADPGAAHDASRSALVTAGNAHGKQEADQGAAADPDGDFAETVSTCCTDNRMLRDRERKAAGLQRVPQLDWDPEWIWALDDRFGRDTELHRLTHATHSCFLMRKGEILFEAEDIGRHNAIDKAVGYAIRKEMPLGRCILYTTGRMPVDMVRKVIRAGIPVMVSKESPTAEGLRLAKAYGLTLIGNLKHGKMHIYL